VARQTKQLEMAERHYIAGGFHSDAVRMYSDAGMWDKAYRIAKTYMKEAEVKQLYLSQAQHMESAGKWRDAEQYVRPKCCKTASRTDCRFADW